MIKQFDFDYIQNTEKLLRSNNAKKLLLAISGGVDSVVLLHHLVEVSRRLPLNLAICYVHHGITDDDNQNLYRNRAQSFVSKLAHQYEIPFHTNSPKETESSSEEFFRDLRDNLFKKWIEEGDFDFVLKAHNQDDLLETRLIRLIRGVGDQGLRSMSFVDGRVMRPILGWSRNEIEIYRKKYELDFIEDPSNTDEKYLRNWIRNRWLTDLEKYRPGAKSSLNRSLNNICDSLQTDSTCDISATIDENGIDRAKLMTLNRLDQRRVFVTYLNMNNIKNFSHSQIDEILKRLDSSKKELKFSIMGCEWHVDTKHITISTGPIQSKK